jgi:hypothetical protein
VPGPRFLQMLQRSIRKADFMHISIGLLLHSLLAGSSASSSANPGPGTILLALWCIGGVGAYRRYSRHHEPIVIRQCRVSAATFDVGVWK